MFSFEIKYEEIKMKNIFLTMMIVMMSFTVCANDKPYTLGTVWEVSYIQVNDGKLEDYLKNLNSGYYPIYEEFKKKGWITSYKAISFSRNNPNDWNLMLLTEYPNWATFDRKEEEWEAVVDKVFKNKQAQDSSDEERTNIRVLWGSKVGREMIPVI
jgi:hypothetical protein